MKQRIVTGVTAGLVFLTFLAIGGYAYAGLILLLSIIGYQEYIRMNGYQSHKVSSWAGLIALVLLAIPWELKQLSSSMDSAAVIWLVMFVLFAITVISKNVITIDQISVILLGVIYIGFGFHYMILTRMLEDGLFWTILIFVCIWGTDSGAYFVGSKFGRHPLWPQISPKKSIEGAIGGILVSIILAVALSLYSPELLSFGQAILLGVVIAIVGQLGDLMQSAYKRVKGIKDTGTLLPGHGGVLDRVDSWLIVFPFLHWLGLIPY